MIAILLHFYDAEEQEKYIVHFPRTVCVVYWFSFMLINDDQMKDEFIVIIVTINRMVKNLVSLIWIYLLSVQRIELWFRFFFIDS